MCLDLHNLLTYFSNDVNVTALLCSVAVGVVLLVLLFEDTANQ